MATSFIPKPTELMTSVLAVCGTVNLKVPSLEVAVPIDEPLTVTVAPATGEPSLLSETLPVTTFSCAKVGSDNKKNSNEHRMLLTHSNRVVDINSGFALALMCN